MGAGQRARRSVPASCSASARSRRAVWATIALARAELARKALSSELIETADRFELVNAVASLALAGEVDEALAGLARVIDVGQRRGDQLAAQTHELWRGLVLYEAGELLLAEETLAIVESTPFWALPLPRAYRAGFLAHVLLERGKIGEAEQVIAAVICRGALAGPSDSATSWQRPRAARDGCAEQALSDFLAAGEAAESIHIRNPAFIPWRSQAALALRQLGRIDEAQALAARGTQACPAVGARRARSEFRYARSVSSRAAKPARSYSERLSRSLKLAGSARACAGADRSRRCSET